MVIQMVMQKTPRKQILILAADAAAITWTQVYHWHMELVRHDVV